MIERSSWNAATRFENSPVKVATDCLARAVDPEGEGTRAFTYVDHDCLQQAKCLETSRLAGTAAGELFGAPISVKDLFDIAGQVTRAGSTVLDESEAASVDAPAVARLKSAGAMVVGRTNMSEFAFSGVGTNPHFGTPANPFDRAARRIPGGSTSGGAVAVADGMCWASLGTDTGGSTRIPAALCGLVGFKPTAARMPRGGMVPLSDSLDSIGTIAHSVADVELLDSVLANSAEGSGSPDAHPLRLAAVTNYVLEGLDQAVSRSFEMALGSLSQAGVEIVSMHLPWLSNIEQMAQVGTFPSIEAYRWHEQLIAERADRYDPLILSRLLRGRDTSTEAYDELRQLRGQLISEAQATFGEFDALVLPTTPIVAPAIEALEDGDEFNRINLLLLRNPSIANLLDGTAISLPCHQPGEAPVGLMLIAGSGRDRQLLRLAARIEAMLPG